METEKKFFSHIDFLTASSMIGDSAYWPWILMRDEKAIKDLSCFIYYREFNKLPECEDDIKSAELTKLVDTFVTNLRAHVQNLFNQLAPQEEIKEKNRDARERTKNFWNKKEEERSRLEKAGKEFLKNNSVDYGGKTVVQIALELGISKAEVRRRKQNGEL